MSSLGGQPAPEAESRTDAEPVAPGHIGAGGDVAEMLGGRMLPARTIRPEQVGYFKSDERHRLFTFRLPEGASATEVLAHARRLPFSYAVFSGALYYAPDARILKPTRARDLKVAWDTVADGRYSDAVYAYWRIVELERFYLCASGEPEGVRRLCRHGP